jgi:hypothetical protein
MAPDDEIAIRRPVWIALANLFLDTDVTTFYASMAQTLAESPYSMDELRRILDDEVSPVLQTNLLTPAGEWAGFDEEWLVAEASKRIGKRRWMPLVGNLDRPWAELTALIEEIRGR